MVFSEFQQLENCSHLNQQEIKELRNKSTKKNIRIKVIFSKKFWEFLNHSTYKSNYYLEIN